MTQRLPFADTALTVLATARLTRLITTDSLGEWAVVGPAEQWARRHDGSSLEYEDGSPALDESRGLRSKLVSGLRCPFCVGFWIGAGVLGTYTLSRRSERRLRLWRFTAGILGLNYVTGHTASRLD